MIVYVDSDTKGDALRSSHRMVGFVPLHWIDLILFPLLLGALKRKDSFPSYRSWALKYKDGQFQAAAVWNFMQQVLRLFKKWSVCAAWESSRWPMYLAPYDRERCSAVSHAHFMGSQLRPVSSQTKTPKLTFSSQGSGPPEVCWAFSLVWYIWGSERDDWEEDVTRLCWGSSGVPIVGISGIIGRSRRSMKPLVLVWKYMIYPGIGCRYNFALSCLSACMCWYKVGSLHGLVFMSSYSESFLESEVLYLKQVIPLTLQSMQYRGRALYAQKLQDTFAKRVKVLQSIPCFFAFAKDLFSEWVLRMCCLILLRTMNSRMRVLLRHVIQCLRILASIQVLTL